MDNNGKKPMKWKELFEALKKIRKTHKIQSLDLNKGIKETIMTNGPGWVEYEWDGTSSITIHFMKRKNNETHQETNK